MPQLQRVASPQLLRMEFHAHGVEVQMGGMKTFFQWLRFELHTKGARFCADEVVSVESLEARGEPFSTQTRETLVNFITYLASLWEVDLRGKVYKVTSKCVNVQRRLNELPSGDLEAMKASVAPVVATPSSPAAPVHPVDLDALADVLLEESPPVDSTLLPSPSRCIVFRARRLVQPLPPNRDLAEIRRITHAISSNFESMLADLRACFG